MKRSKGFTLIELLVVVAIIGILIAILIPSLAKAKELAVRAVCAANLKSQGEMFVIYAAQYNDSMPLFPNPGSGNWLTDIPTGFTDYLLNAKSQVVGVSAGNTMDSHSQRKVFYCPANPEQNADFMWSQWIAADRRSLGYNYLTRRTSSEPNFNGVGPPTIPAAVSPPVRWLDLLNGNRSASSSLVVAFDVIITLQADATDTSFLYPLQASSLNLNTTSHIKGKNPSGQNVLAADAHVEWRSWSRPTAIKIGSGDNLVYQYLQR